jgi:hypothetical protein
MRTEMGHFLFARSRLGWLICVVALAACQAERAATRESARVGQWIWTRTDLARFDESRRSLPTLDAAVWVGTVRCDTTARRLTARSAMSPRVNGAATVAAVIRFDDGLDRCRSTPDSAGVFAAALDSVVGVLRERLRVVPLSAVQLDYDAPQRALRAWAASVRQLRRGALAGDTVWVTSIIAHLREPLYGELFRDVVHGHVLQVFDTGEPASDVQVSEALRLAERAGMRFRLGVGAFERVSPRGATEHRLWFRTLSAFAKVRGYGGVWVFPAGQSWTSFLPERG